MALAGWSGIVALGVVVGQHLEDRDPFVLIGAPPLVGLRDVHLSGRLWPAVVLGVAAAAFGPGLAARLSWRALLPATGLLAGAWAVALAAADGWHALIAPLLSRYDPLAAAGRVGSPGAFLRGFTTHLGTYPTHVKGHPPGFVLLAAGLRSIGLGGATPLAVLCIGAGAAAAPLAMLAARELGAGALARRAAPFLALAPAAVWIATSDDALFLGVSAAGVALLAAGAARRRDGLCAVAGVVIGIGLFLSYGLAPLGLVALAASRGRPRPLAIAAAGVAAVVLAFALLGFWWIDGLNATHHFYRAGVAARRPYLTFLVVDLAAFALAVGPAAVAGFARLRERPAVLLPAAALIALLVSDLSGFSRGETERIWLPFVPWILLAAGTVRSPRAWLGAQVGLGLILQAGFRSPW